MEVASPECYQYNIRQFAQTYPIPSHLFVFIFLLSIDEQEAHSSENCSLNYDKCWADLRHTCRLLLSSSLSLSFIFYHLTQHWMSASHFSRFPSFLLESCWVLEVGGSTKFAWNKFWTKQTEAFSHILWNCVNSISPINQIDGSAPPRNWILTQNS